MSIPQKFCIVNGYNMAYVESVGAGEEILLFLHGNPTSSYLWRNIMDPLKEKGRLIAPDLIGMGDSDKLNNSGVGSYRFEEHVDFLDQLIECAIGGDTMNKRIVLVIHDWGSALGFWWAYRHPHRIKGIVYMEAMVMPLEYDDLEPGLQEFFQGMRTPGVGEQLILNQNVVIEQILPAAIIRNLTEEEMNVYRAPYLQPGESRRPALAFPREVPINGTPANVVNIVSMYSEWMGTNEIPKLFINANPGSILTGRSRDLVRTWKNQVEVSVPGIHFIQEDSPTDIANAIDGWLASDIFVTTDVVSSASPSSSPPSSSSPIYGVSGGTSYAWMLALVWALRRMF
jgi:haloalkane dehalogenase